MVRDGSRFVSFRLGTQVYLRRDVRHTGEVVASAYGVVTVRWENRWISQEHESDLRDARWPCTARRYAS